MPASRLFVLGPPRLQRDGRPVDMSLRRAIALVVYSAITEQPRGRDALAALLWPDADQREGRARLRRTLHRLSKALGDEVIVAEGDSLRLAPGAELWVDSRDFEQHAALGLAEGPAAAPAPERLEHLVRAAELYMDDFLAGFSLPECADWDEWQFFQREHLRRTYARVLERLVEAHEAAANWEAAIPHAHAWVALDPLHEPAQRALIRTYAAAGQLGAALRQYQECSRLLRTELDVEPEAETTALFEAIRSRRISATLTAPVIASGAAPAAPTIGPAGRSLLAPLPETRYARSGEVSIAYQVVGDGPIDIVFVMGWVSHLDYYWEEPSFARFLNHLASFSRLILFDKRGTGLSDRAVGLPSLEERMDDVRAVMDAVGSERAAVVGVSEGGSMSILFSATYPERTSALVLIGCFPRRLWAPDFPWAPTMEERQRVNERLDEGWGTAEWAAWDVERRAPSAATNERFVRWWATYLRMSASPGAALALREMNNEIDVRHVLPFIRVPTLIIHRTGDRTVPVELSRYMAQRIPDARYVELSGDDHLPFVGNQDEIADHIEHFLTDIPSSREAERVLLTLLFVELVDAERQTNTPGDQRLHERVDGFQAVVRRALARFRGSEVTWDGSRLLAGFDGPARAIRCADAIAETAGLLGLQVRAGLHTGECELNARVVRGIAVDIAARVTECARAGEVLVSGTVKDLVAGSGILFDDLGTRALDGIPGEWRLFRVALEAAVMRTANVGIDLERQAGDPRLSSNARHGVTGERSALRPRLRHRPRRDRD